MNLEKSLEILFAATQTPLQDSGKPRRRIAPSGHQKRYCVAVFSPGRIHAFLNLFMMLPNEFALIHL